MKPLSVRTFSLRSLFATGTFAIAAAIALGAESSPIASEAPDTFAVDFSGGSLAQLVAQLESTPPHWSVDIVGSKADLDAATVPPFSVHHIHKDQLMGLLANILPKSGFMFAPFGPEGAVLSRREANGASNFVSHDLSPFLNTRSVDDIVDAIRTACSMNPSPNGPELKIKYHPRTKLLLISGNEQDIGIAIRVLNSLVPQRETKN